MYTQYRKNTGLMKRALAREKKVMRQKSVYWLIKKLGFIFIQYFTDICHYF